MSKSFAFDDDDDTRPHRGRQAKKLRSDRRQIPTFAIVVGGVLVVIAALGIALWLAHVTENTRLVDECVRHAEALRRCDDKLDKVDKGDAERYNKLMDDERIPRAKLLRDAYQGLVKKVGAERAREMLVKRLGTLPMDIFFEPPAYRPPEPTTDDPASFSIPAAAPQPKKDTSKKEPKKKPK